LIATLTDNCWDVILKLSFLGIQYKVQLALFGYGISLATSTL